MNSSTKLLNLLLILTLSNCTIVEPEEPEDPIPNEIPELTINASVDRFHMITTCEGNGTIGEGDLYSRVYILANSNVGTEPTVIAETAEIIHSLGFNAILTDTGISATATLTPFNGMKLQVDFFIKEVDPNSIQISRKYSQTIIYDESNACWLPITGFDCVDGSDIGQSTLSSKFEERMTDQTCDVLIDWSINISK